MAGVNYEVNIQLNAKTLDKQLGDLEKRVNNLKKNLAAPLRNQDRASQRAIKNAEKAAKLEDRIRATRVITYNLGTRLNKLEEKGVKVSEQRVRLNRAATSTNKKLVEQARTHNKLVREFVVAEERKLKLGVKTGRMQAESTNALFSAKVRRYGLDQQIRRLEEEGLKTDKLRIQLGKITQAQIDRKFATHKQLSAQLALDIRKERDKLGLQKRQTREIERQARIGGRRSPIGGRANIPGSPAALASQRQARSQRLQGVALGAGFPLLFGGGPGAILGGAAGGLVGGPAGFAAQIALSALGQQFDTFVGSTLKASQAFTSTSKAFDLVRERSLFSSQQIEARAVELEKQGKVEELAKLLTQELSAVIGTDGVKSLQLLGKETSEVTRLWGQLTLQLQALIAGPLANFLKLVNQFVGGITLRSQFNALEQSVTPAQAKRLNQILTEKRGTRTISAPQQRAALSDPRLQTAPITKDIGKQITLPGTITNEVLRQTLEQAAKENIKAPATPLIPVTPLDRLTITPPKTKEGRRSRLGDFRSDLAQAQELFTLEKSIYQARFNDDRRALIRFEKVRELLSIREKEQTVLASDRTDAEKRVQLDALALERKRASLEETYKLADLERTMGQERGKAMLAAIEQQNQLNLGLQQQLQLADSLSQVLGQGLTRSFDLLIDGAQNWGMALRDIAANVLRDIARQLIQIFVIEQAVGFLRQAFGPGPQFGSNYSVDGIGTAGPNFGIPQRARGGPVSANQPYMVGERGPELFVPGANGNIVPNNAMGGVQVGSINITVENTGDQLSPAAQKQIANQVQGIVMATLVNERRSGGVLR